MQLIQTTTHDVIVNGRAVFGDERYLRWVGVANVDCLSVAK